MTETKNSPFVIITICIFIGSLLIFMIYTLFTPVHILLPPQCKEWSKINSLVNVTWASGRQQFFYDTEKGYVTSTYLQNKGDLICTKKLLDK